MIFENPTSIPLTQATSARASGNTRRGLWAKGSQVRGD